MVEERRATRAAHEVEPPRIFERENVDYKTLEWELWDQKLESLLVSADFS